MAILVTNLIESMKWSENKQLAGYIFACCITLASILPLSAGFAAQSLLAVSLCQLAILESGSSGEYGCAWQQVKTLPKTWVGEVAKTIGASWHYFHVVQGLRTSLIGRPLGLSTSDNNKNIHNNNGKGNSNSNDSNNGNNNNNKHNHAI